MPLYVLDRPDLSTDSVVADDAAEAAARFYGRENFPPLLPDDDDFPDFVHELLVRGYHVHGVDDCDGGCAVHRDWLDALHGDDAVDRARGYA